MSQQYNKTEKRQRRVRRLKRLRVRSKQLKKAAPAPLPVATAA